MLSLVDLVTRIERGELSRQGSVDLAAAAIESREPEIGAFAHRPPTLRASSAGALSGIAVGLKDIIDTADMPTGHGSAIYEGWRPRADAAVVATLKRLGATIAGKTTTTAFAYLDPTPTRNPAAPGHTPGGSSSGSAAAVAAGMVPLALGTQTGGSVIRPASFCGVAAIKPSFRLIPTTGVKTYAWTLDTVGLFAATIADLQLGFELVTGRPSGRDRDGPIRFGVLRQDFAGPADPCAEHALARGVAALKATGSTVQPLEAPPALAEAWASHATVQRYESRQALAWEYDNHRARLPPLLGRELDIAAGVTAAEYDDARRLARAARRQARDLFAEIDALVTFSAPGAAPAGLGSTGEARFNRLWTMLGTPCVNVPGLLDEAGHPVGLQVIAPFARDDVALWAASLLEHAMTLARFRDANTPKH